MCNTPVDESAARIEVLAAGVVGAASLDGDGAWEVEDSRSMGVGEQYGGLLYDDDGGGDVTTIASEPEKIAVTSSSSYDMLDDDDDDDDDDCIVLGRQPAPFNNIAAAPGGAFSGDAGGWTTVPSGERAKNNRIGSLCSKALTQIA